jgi:transposase
MDLLSVIRRWHFRQGMPIREIERRTALSRNTIRKYLRSDTLEPVFKTSVRPSKLDEFSDKLSGWLLMEANKSRKQKRTAKQMHADLVVLGFDGSYERVAAFVRAWKADRQREQQTSGRGTFVPLVFGAGEGCHTAVLLWCGPIRSRPTRCYLTHWPKRFGHWAVSLSGVSLTI